MPTHKAAGRYVVKETQGILGFMPEKRTIISSGVEIL
jgi:hypothetical protein